MASAKPELPILHCKDRKAWTAWLETNHAKSAGVWLKLAKKGADCTSASYGEALEEALRYGWIDGQKKAYDGSFWLQRFTPRGPRSIWSKANREKAEELMRDGRMKPAGLAAVERARQNGRWDAAYDSQSRSTVPSDLQAELDRNPRAKAFFETLESYNRYAILFRLQTAPRAETRAKRLQQFIGMLERGEKIHP